ncbi:MAG: hypothetical protein ABW122_13260 [Ilumatobacteraceae bacterium]
MSTFETAGTAITGHSVLDPNHHRLGTITDVLYDERGNASWAVVDPGPMRAEHVVPVEGSYLAASGDVMIPYAKSQVKHSPKVHRDHILGARVEIELREHYDVR